MPAPLKIQPNGGGTTVASIDSSGNETITGTLTVGQSIILDQQSSAPVQTPGAVTLYTTGNNALWVLNPDGSQSLISSAGGTGAPSDWLNVLAFGATGNGATDDAPAIQAALNAAKFGETVYLPSRNGAVQTTFAVNSTLTVPPYITLRGAQPKRSGNTVGGAITALPTFTGTTIISMVDQATGGYSVANENVVLTDLVIDGTNGPANVNGVTATGYVHGVQLINVNVSNVTGRAYQSLSNSSGNPYSWYFLNCQAANNASHGFRFSNMTDTLWINCRAIGCGGRGFYFGSNFNSTAIGCRAEFCQIGWYITENWGTSGNGGGMWFVGCSTDRSTNDGWNIDATGNSPLQFTGIECRRDGRNNNAGGNGYAAFRINGATVPITITDLTTSPGVDDNNTGVQSPDYGFRSSGATYASVANSYVWGVVAGWRDDGTNTNLRRGDNIAESTGTIAAPVPVLTNGLQSDSTGVRWTANSGTIYSLVENGWLPEDQGVIAWTTPPASASVSSGVVTSGTIFLQQIVLRRAATISNITLGVATAGANLTANECFVGLYKNTASNTATLVASSADQSASWNTTGTKTIALSSSYTAAAGIYWVAVLANGTTPPVFYKGATTTSGIANLGLSNNLPRATSFSANPILPATLTLTSGTTVSSVILALLT